MILLDEPTSHLDVKYKLEFLSLLREMARKKELSVIMSLHELDLAERISDRVVCIKDGRMDPVRNAGAGLYTGICGGAVRNDCREI